MTRCTKTGQNISLCCIITIRHVEGGLHHIHCATPSACSSCSSASTWRLAALTMSSMSCDTCSSARSAALSNACIALLNFAPTCSCSGSAMHSYSRILPPHASRVRGMTGTVRHGSEGPSLAAALVVFVWSSVGMTAFGSTLATA